MPLRLRNKIGIKLFLILTLVFALAMLPLAYGVFQSVNALGHSSASLTETQIKQQAQSFLSRLGAEQGNKYSEYFNRVSSSAELMAVQAGLIYSDLRSYAAMADISPDLQLQETNGMFLSAQEASVSTIYWGGKTLSPEVKTEIKALTHLDPILQRTKALLPEALATHAITLSGIGRYYTESEKGREVVRHLPKSSDFDLRDGAPVTLFTKENHTLARSQWTEIYKDDVLDGLMMTSAAPIVAKNGTFYGIVGIDLPLQTIIWDILMENISPGRDSGWILFSFLINKNGNFIAFPKEYLEFLGFHQDLSLFKNSADIMRINLADSDKVAVKNIVANILGNENIVQTLTVLDENYFMASHNLKDLDWKLILVTRENDLISSVQQSQNVQMNTIASLKRDFLFSSLVAAIVVMSLVYMAVRYFVAPLKEVTRVAMQVGEGNLAARCGFNRMDELGSLAAAMNSMIGRLAKIDEIKNSYSLRLEEEIKARTHDLELKNQKLDQLVRILHREGDERKVVTEALVESEGHLRRIMESSIAGLCIVQQGRFKYVNEALAAMLGYNRIELTTGLGPSDVVSPEFQEVVDNRVKQREDGGYKPIQSFEIKARAKDGTLFDVLVAGANITWDKKPAALGTIVDISHQKKVEEQLRINEKRLQASIEEKSVLLREVYHRTKNNMLVIISMLSLQMDGITDSKARKVMEDTENRIRAMAMVHESLCNSANLAEINLAEYLEKLVKTLVQSMTLERQIDFEPQANLVLISFDQAIPVGLVVNELVTNSIKHAFLAGCAGKIRLSLSRSEGIVELVVADNGIGLPEHLDIGKSTSFGLQISRFLVEKQLRGNITINRQEGTEYVIRFAG